ncbi:hypothetical protein BAUCODRAFT_34376 [Baudoinia panamericana UAMH 10762]|uniref:Uncharacterized protein n=1 Tax=Baudoinia panamericana (strain UAMH 10762) TaxID=717646 RepID=M2N952_BAUPA|nr:uncharacterized protein BAUCODRAFT_34376 [Baudoinia panamericana UAMH 10762]EMC95619.1 hypothetical protein BAUCODRAFT_34376 [Baudoinia panamericana UAMH 10762]
MSNDFRSVTGGPQTAEPITSSKDAATGNNGNSTTSKPAQDASSAPKRSSSQHRQPPVQIPPLRKQRSSNLLLPSNSSSPQTSRNTSPIRKDSRPAPLSTPISTQPSAAAIQRALSAANVPQLPASTGPITEAVSRLPRSSKSAGGGSGDTTPQMPLSPRLKSPPPSATGSRRGSAPAAQKKVEPASMPSISVQSPAQQATIPPTKPSSEDVRKAEQQLQAPPKAPSRGPSGKSTLETVQENSTDSVVESPAAVQAAADLKPLTTITEGDKLALKQDEGDKHTQPGESGSESAGSKLDRGRGRRQSLTQSNKSAQRQPIAAKTNYAPLSSAKSRQPEGKPNMTVETETVPSIPQSALNAGDRSGSGRNDHGSVRLKPSNETIRPKKERKKASQKSRSLNQGTASSKADIFEARVASQVDEANTSDSDETFVYESNPPEPQRRPRLHSRTPSVTSSHSTADQQRSAVRSFGEAMDDRKVAGKRSMKFSNNPYHDVDSPESKDGTIRSTPRHFGKFGRGASHASSMFDADSPFTQASKLRTGHLNTRHSRPNSPRSPQSLLQHGRGERPATLFSGRKAEQSFDFDGEGADDERTPLVGSVRTARSARHGHRRINSGSVRSLNDNDYYVPVQQPRSCCSRFGSCLIGFCVLVAVVLTAVAFLVVSNRPLEDVRIRKIQNVLASEQEIMLDLLVGAVNPNALGITVADMDINVFAKSKHVGTVITTSRSKPAVRRWEDLSDHWHSPSNSGGVDQGTDPPDDLERDAQTMLLGRILHFDQALSFEGSPVKHHEHFSVGELRLAKPGNKTEAGGSERWENVLKHPFELIVRGVLKYNLPISMRLQSVSVSGSVLVHPEDGVDELGKMRTEPVEHKDHWQWVNWKELRDGDEWALGEERVKEVEDG